MAPLPIFGEHLLYGSIDHAIDAGRGVVNLLDTASGWSGQAWGHLTQVYSDWVSPEPQLFEDSCIHELAEWEKSTEWTKSTDSLSSVDSWFEGDSWSSDDTFTETGSLVEFDDDDGVDGETSSSATPQVEWWELPKALRPKNPMPLDYQKSSSSLMTGPPEVPIDITTVRDSSVIVPRLRTRPDMSTYTTHDFGTWPWGTIVPPQNDLVKVVREYGDGDWLLTKRWVPPTAADLGLLSATGGSCDSTLQLASMVAVVGGVAIVILGLKVWRIRTRKKYWL